MPAVASTVAPREPADGEPALPSKRRTGRLVGAHTAGERRVGQPAGDRLAAGSPQTLRLERAATVEQATGQRVSHVLQPEWEQLVASAMGERDERPVQRVSLPEQL